MALVIETELGTKEFEKQLEALKNKLSKDKKKLEELMQLQQKGVFKTDYGTRNIEKLNVSIEKTKNQIMSLQTQQQKLGEVGEEAGERSGKGFEKGLRSLKRFGMALLGVRGAFTLIRRATSSYLNEHEETANKINSIWVALGNALAPIIEFIANAVLKLIGYLNVFLQALGFDVDLTKNMGKSSKAIDKTTKSMKELDRQVASFDEANVMQSDTSSGGGGGTDSGAFAMPELNKDIVNFLQDTAKFLKENWEWLALIGTVIAGYKVTSWLSSLGLLGKALSTLATIGIVAVGVNFLYDAVTGRDLIQDIKTIAEWLPKLNGYHKNNTKMVKENNDVIQNFIETQHQKLDAMEKGSQATNDYYYKLRDMVTGLTISNKTMANHIDKMSGVEFFIATLTNDTAEYTERLNDNNATLKGVIQEMANMYTRGLLNDEQQKQFFEILKAVDGELVNGQVQFKNMETTISQAGHKTEKYEDILKATGNTAKTTFDNMKTSANNFMNDISKLKATPSIQFKANIEDLKSKVEQLSKIPLLNVGNVLTNTLTKLRAVGLARGGIINNPGKGVPISGVIGGEATGAAEGVVPLNNEQSMELIGQAVARHVTINLTNNTMLDGKVIAREQRKIQDSTNFATNGRGV